MMTEKRKSILVWSIGIAIASICFLVVSIPFALRFYPYGIAILGVYFALTVLFPILFRVYKKSVFGIISFVLFLLPLIPLGYFLIGFL